MAAAAKAAKAEAFGHGGKVLTTQQNREHQQYVTEQSRRLGAECRRRGI